MKNPFSKMLRNLAQKALTYALTDHSFGRILSGTTTVTGKQIDHDSALRIATVWGCVRILAESVGSLPWAIYEEDTAGNSKKVEHDLGRVLCESPNPDMTSVEYKESMIHNLALQGNTYSLRDTRQDGSVISLYPIPAPLVSPQMSATGAVSYKINDRGKWEEYPREKIWHVKGFGPNGLVGLSPIAYAAQAMGIAMASEEFQGRFFAMGASPSWIISIPNWLKPDQRAIARENIENLWGGLANAHRTQLLEGGMTAAPASMPLVDAQFLELRSLSVEEICRIFRIQPHLVAKLDRSTNNNIEQQSLEFVMYTLQPYLTRIESSATKWLFKPEERKKFRLRFNIEGFLRADAKTRGELYASALQNGWMNRNEVRALENLNNVPGLDEYTAQTNLAPVAMLSKLAEKIATPAPAPVITPPLGPPGEKMSLYLTNNLPSPGEHKTTVLNVVPERPNVLTIQPADVKVVTNVAPANVGAEFEATVNVAPADIDFKEVTGAFRAVAEALAAQTKEMARPNLLVKDEKGNTVGTRKVDQL